MVACVYVCGGGGCMEWREREGEMDTPQILQNIKPDDLIVQAGPVIKRDL